MNWEALRERRSRRVQSSYLRGGLLPRPPPEGLPVVLGPFGGGVPPLEFAIGLLLFASLDDVKSAGWRETAPGRPPEAVRTARRGGFDLEVDSVAACRLTPGAVVLLLRRAASCKVWRRSSTVDARRRGYSAFAACPSRWPGHSGARRLPLLSRRSAAVDGARCGCVAPLVGGDPRWRRRCFVVQPLVGCLRLVSRAEPRTSQPDRRACTEAGNHARWM